jgi:hypothetical protein
MRRIAAGDEPDLAEVQCLEHLEGGPQVSVVDRVEGPPEDAERPQIVVLAVTGCLMPRAA